MKSFAEALQTLSRFRQQTAPDPYRPVEDYFKCQVSQMGSEMLPILNGWYVHCLKPSA